MCIIIVNKAGELIKDEILLKSAAINPHGLGITWLDTYKTDYSLSSEWQVLRTDRPYIAHFRFATIGDVNESNMHPFPIGDTGCLLFQNGSVLNLGDKDRTDAEHMAEILDKTDYIHWEYILEMTECRWVIVDTIGKNVDLFNEEMFVERDNILYSKANVLEGELVSVYGTLKRGFGNNRLMGMSKFIGSGKTYNQYPMIVSGIPFVLPRKGEGHNVKVEVFMVDKATLEGSLDSLEGHPTTYDRRKTLIELDSGEFITTWLYFYDHYHNVRFENAEYQAEYTLGYRPSSIASSDNLFGWHNTDDQTIHENEWLDKSICDKCGQFDTIWSQTRQELYCNTCIDYTTSIDITKP